MKIAELEKLWDEFSGTSFVESKLNSQFYAWDIGTSSIEILSWFNQPDGIAEYAV